MEIQVAVYENDNPVPGRSKIVQVHLLDGKTVLEPVVDADLDRFAKFYAEKLGNGNLSKFERAVIKTYLWWKTHPEQ